MRELEIVAQSSLQLVKIEEADLDVAKAFVLSVVSSLTNSDYFITSDIDSLFERLVCQQEGFVYGIASDGQLVALQAIDIFAVKNVDFNPGDLLSSVKNCYESTLTLCRSEYRRKGLSSLLHDSLARDSRAAFGAHCHFATVHPENLGSLLLYSSLGYADIGHLLHFGLPRRLLHRPRE